MKFSKENRFFSRKTLNNIEIFKKTWKNSRNIKKFNKHSKTLKTSKKTLKKLEEHWKTSKNIQKTLKTLRTQPKIIKFFLVKMNEMKSRAEIKRESIWDRFYVKCKGERDGSSDKVKWNSHFVVR